MSMGWKANTKCHAHKYDGIMRVMSLVKQLSQKCIEASCANKLNWMGLCAMFCAGKMNQIVVCCKWGVIQLDPSVF